MLEVTPCVIQDKQICNWFLAFCAGPDCRILMALFPLNLTYWEHSDRTGWGFICFSCLSLSLLLSNELHFFLFSFLGLFSLLLASLVSYPISLFHHPLKQKYSRLHLCFLFLILFVFPMGTWPQILIHATAKSLTEYQLARPSDANRKEMLFGSLARPGHPMKKFFWGKFWIKVLSG